MKKILLSSLFVCSLFTACTQLEEEKPVVSMEGHVCFSGSVGSSSRATASAFEEGDSISLFAFRGDNPWIDGNAPTFTNIKYGYNGTLFTTAKGGITYPENTPLSFVAVYPTIASTAATFRFEVEEDQSLEGSYAKSDLMTAFAASTSQPVPNLLFNHRLSSVVVNLTFEQIPAGTTSVSFSSVDGVDVNLATGTYVKGTGNILAIRAAGNGTNSYRAILPPQTIAPGAEFVYIQTEGGTTYRYVLPGELILKSGRQRTFNLTVTAAGKVIVTSEDETPFGGKLVVRPRDGKEDVSFILENIQYDENDLWNAEASGAIILDAILGCEVYNSISKTNFGFLADNYSPEQTQFQMDEFYMSYYSDQQNSTIEFRKSGTTSPDNITAEISKQDMNLTLDFSGNGTLTRSIDGTSSIADIVSDHFVLPIMYVGITKKNVQQMSELNYPSLSFELPFPIDEALIVTECKHITKGGTLFYLEGSPALYEEMKRRIEASNFVIKEENADPDGSIEGVWMKDNLIINVDYSVSGMGVILKDDVQYHFTVDVFERSGTTARSASFPLLNMNKTKKLRNNQRR